MRTTAVLCLLVLAAVAVPTPTGSSASKSLVFTHATVIDVRTGHIFRDQTIVVAGDRITALSPRAEIPATAEVVNAAGKLVDGPKPVWPDSVAVRSKEQAREAVDMLHKDGVDFIKVYSRLPRVAYFAVAAAAKKDGLSFVGHVPIYVSASDAAIAGQRSIEHLSEILFACSHDESDLRKPLVATAIGAERDRVRKEQLKV